MMHNYPEIFTLKKTQGFSEKRPVLYRVVVENEWPLESPTFNSPMKKITIADGKEISGACGRPTQKHAIQHGAFF